MNMKFFGVVFLIFIWLAPVIAQYDFDAKEKERMSNAKVKTQTQWTYEYVDGKPSAKGYKSAVTKYDNKGNITEITNFNDQGKVILFIVYQYDARDNRVNNERYQGNREKLQYSQKIEYDTKSNKIREYGFDGATPYNNKFKYDANGRLSEIEYTIDNALIEKRKLAYSGNKTEITVYDPNNNLTFKQENTYNNKGLLISEIRIGVTGSVVHSLNLNYNTAGDLMEEVKKRDGDKLDYQKTYQYDSANRPVKEETVNLDGTKFVSHEYHYNNSGDLIMESWKKTERAKEPSTKKLTYDAKGIYTDVECYWATYPLKSLYKYVYEFY